MQKIVIFIEADGSETMVRKQLSKLANLLMNRFTIEQDANHEILGIINLEPCSMDFYGGKNTPEEGLDLIFLNFVLFLEFLCKNRAVFPLSRSQAAGNSNTVLSSHY